MIEQQPKIISRRTSLRWLRDHAFALAVTGVAGGAIGSLVIYQDKQPAATSDRSLTLPELPPENLQPFIPPVDINEQLDIETFKTLTEELFAFANQVDAGNVYSVDTGHQTDHLTWKRIITFQEDDVTNQLHLRHGYKTLTKVGAAPLPDSSAREIALGRFNSRLGIPFTSLIGALLDPKDFIDNLVNSRVVNFTADQPPRLYWPPPPGMEKMSSETVLEPQELSPTELAAFLKQAIESFNARIPVQEKIPKIIPSRVA